MTGYEFVQAVIELIIFAIRCIKGENTTRKTNTAQTKSIRKYMKLQNLSMKIIKTDFISQISRISY